MCCNNNNNNNNNGSASNPTHQRTNSSGDIYDDFLRFLSGEQVLVPVLKIDS
jgi:hypothetical protein